MRKVVATLMFALLIGLGAVAFADEGGGDEFYPSDRGDILIVAEEGGGDE
jgi:hypothetical protein